MEKFAEAPLVRFVGTWDAGRGMRLTDVQLQSDVQTLDLSFSWPSAASATLRADLSDILANLLQSSLGDGQGPAALHAQNYIAQLSGLRLEDLILSYNPENRAFEVRLRMTSGQVSALFYVPSPEKNYASMEDVFLPLTNLSAYLRAMSEHDTGTRNNACELTADRIDEFLLIYGGRLKSDIDPVLMPRQIY